MSVFIQVFIVGLSLLSTTFAGVAEDRLTDSMALWAIKEANPSSSLNWVNTKPINTWDGVTVNATSGRVTQLNLSKMALSTLPPIVGNLAELTFLNLSSNQLGEFPVALQTLTVLEDLYLSDNSITTIPAWLNKLTKGGEFGTQWIRTFQLP